LYESYGITDWDAIVERIRFLRHAHDVRYFIVDNLTCLSAIAEDERREIERIMAEAAGLAQELGAFIWMVSHLTAPAEGESHETGGRVLLRHLKGSRAIAAWAHGAVGIERDQQAEDEVERHRSRLRVLKDRYTGRATGKVVPMIYEATTGTLREDTSPESLGFRDETATPEEDSDF
jgi:twinkle protein